MSELSFPFSEFDRITDKKLETAAGIESQATKIGRSVLRRARGLKTILQELEEKTLKAEKAFKEADQFIGDKTAELRKELSGRSFLVTGTVYTTSGDDKRNGFIQPSLSIETPLPIKVRTVQAIYTDLSYAVGDRFMLRALESLIADNVWIRSDGKSSLDESVSLAGANIRAYVNDSSYYERFDPIALLQITDNDRKDIGIEPLALDIFTDVSPVFDRFVFARLRDISLTSLETDSSEK